MEKRPIVTIIVPTYNSGEYLQETINSCCNQTYKNVEIIVIDDCSTDGTVKYLQSLEKVTLYLRDKNQGLTKNINYAFSYSTGEYILLLGHDDVIPCNHIEKMVSELECGVGLLWCNSIIIDEASRVKNWLTSHKNNIDRTQNYISDLAIYNFISSCGMLINASAFKALGGFDERYKIHAEWLFYSKLARNYNIKYTQKSYGLYRIHARNITKTIKKDKELMRSYKNECVSEANKLVTNKFVHEFRRMFFELKMIVGKLWFL